MVKKFPNKEGFFAAIASIVAYMIMFRGSVYTIMDLLLFVVSALGVFFTVFLVISYAACMDSLEVKEVGNYS